MVKADIEVHERDAPKGAEWRSGASREMRSYNAHGRVYFSHKDENVMENFVNRRARPTTLYKTYLGEVCDKLGIPRTTKLVWSPYAGCNMCPCSPGFVIKCDEARRKDVWVTLSADAPRTSEK